MSRMLTTYTCVLVREQLVCHETGAFIDGSPSREATCLILPFRVCDETSLPYKRGTTIVVIRRCPCVLADRRHLWSDTAVLHRQATHTVYHSTCSHIHRVSFPWQQVPINSAVCGWTGVERAWQGVVTETSLPSPLHSPPPSMWGLI